MTTNEQRQVECSKVEKAVRGIGEDKGIDGDTLIACWEGIFRDYTRVEGYADHLSNAQLNKLQVRRFYGAYHKLVRLLYRNDTNTRS